MKKKLLSTLIVGAACLGLLSACGGGGGGSSDGGGSTPQTPSSTFSGVAAVGAPLVGSVTVKDAAGTTRTVTIGSNGSYSVDVTGMTAPFVFRATGTANGHTYVVHSAATSADANGTINITQLTDLIVHNIAGELASTYFENGSFSTLTATELNAEVAKLKEKLLPVLTAIGVDNSVDLLRTQFTPLASALDQALDVLRVSVDPVANEATITNIVTQQQIIDDLQVKAAAETSPPVLNDTSNVTNGLTDAELIKNTLANFTALFASGHPSQAAIETYFTDDYLGEDADGSTWAAAFSSDAALIGATFSDINIKSIDYSNLNNVIAIIDFTAKDQNGVEMDRMKNFRMHKGMDNMWRLHGDQRVLDVSGYVQVYRDNNNDCVMTGLEFDIIDDDSGNNGGTINHIMVYGPGLPGAGLRYIPAGGGHWNLQGNDSPYYVMANSCAQSQPVADSDIANIPDNAVYLVKAFSSADNSVPLNFPSGAITNAANPFANGGYAVQIEKRPLTLAEAVASTRFPSIVPATSTQFESYVSGPLHVSASNINPGHFVDIILEHSTMGGDYRSDEAYVAPTSNGTIDVDLSLPPPGGGDTVTSSNLSVGTYDNYRRAFITSE